MSITEKVNLDGHPLCSSSTPYLCVENIFKPYHIAICKQHEEISSISK